MTTNGFGAALSTVATRSGGGGGSTPAQRFKSANKPTTSSMAVPNSNPPPTTTMIRKTGGQGPHQQSQGHASSPATSQHLESNLPPTVDPQEIAWLCAFFGVETLGQVRKELTEFRSKHLPRGVILGRVCLRMVNYIPEGIVGWINYTRDSFLARCPLLGYAFQVLKGHEYCIDFQVKNVDKIYSKIWGKSVAASRWWYGAFKHIYSECQRLHVTLAPTDWQAVRETLHQFWTDHENIELKKMSFYSYKDKKEIVCRWTKEDDFDKAIWLPFLKFWNGAPGLAGRNGNVLSDDPDDNFFALDTTWDPTTGGNNNNNSHNNNNSRKSDFDRGGDSDLDGWSPASSYSRGTAGGLQHGSLTVSGRGSSGGGGFGGIRSWLSSTTGGQDGNGGGLHSLRQQSHFDSVEPRPTTTSRRQQPAEQGYPGQGGDHDDESIPDSEAPAVQHQASPDSDDVESLNGLGAMEDSDGVPQERGDSADEEDEEHDSHSARSSSTRGGRARPNKPSPPQRGEQQQHLTGKKRGISSSTMEGTASPRKKNAPSIKRQRQDKVQAPEADEPASHAPQTKRPRKISSHGMMLVSLRQDSSPNNDSSNQQDQARETIEPDDGGGHAGSKEDGSTEPA